MVRSQALDFRRYVRPLFLSPDGQHPTRYKIYYDVFTYFATQTAFSFTTVPFVVLSLRDSLLVWQRVYFYAIIGTIVSMAFFASPGKAWLIQQQKKRGAPQIKRTPSQQALSPGLGLPNDPERDIDDALREIREEVEVRRRRGSLVAMPTGSALRTAIEEKIGRKL
jgi:lysophospholipid acyltransferase